MRSAAGSTDRSICLDQAELLLDRAYVHLALKRAMHGVDPVQRVKVLRGRADALSDADFRRQLQRIFLTTRDMHTAFTFSDGGERVAVLPFRLDRCFVAERPVYLVTELEFGFSHPQFVQGVEVTHWNGVPVGRAVDAVAELTGAGNAEARSARGLATLTQRPLRYMAPPDELEATPRDATRGVDALVDVQQRTRQRLFSAPPSDRTAEEPATPDAGPAVSASLSGFIEVDTVQDGAHRLGLLRIRSFEVPSIDAFVGRGGQVGAIDAAGRARRRPTRQWWGRHPGGRAALAAVHAEPGREHRPPNYLPRINGG